MTYERESMELITIEQLPVVAERFSQMVEPTRQRVDEILAMECTDETKKAVKAERASLRRFREDMKNAVKAKKNELFAPWMAVEAEVGRIDKLCEDADEQLRKKISAVENGEKRRRESAVLDYFFEKCSALGIEWFTFEQTGIKVRLSDSISSLLRTVDQITERIAGDTDVIRTMDDAAPIMAEYKKCLCLSEAVKTIADRKREIAAESEAIGMLEEKRTANSANAAAVEAICTDAREKEKLKAPVCVCDDKGTLVQADTTSGKRFKAEFRVTGTLEQLRALKKYMIDNGIEIIE